MNSKVAILEYILFILLIAQNVNNLGYHAYTYAGYRYDKETGLYFLNSRYYAAGIGRFLTKDNVYQDLTNPHTLNRYTYTGGDPVNRFDPNGHFWFLLPFLGEGALMALVVIGNYFATVASAPDFQQDVQMTAMDLAEGNYVAAAADVVSAAIPVVSATAVKAIGKAVHGNSLKTTKAAVGYALKNKSTGELLKYGETTLGPKRYTRKYLLQNNARMDVMASGTKQEMHDWQHNMILEYKFSFGKRPDLNKSDW